MHNEITTEIIVLGSGPGGYSAAFRCADLGFKTVIVEQHTNLGGVCLNVGCIPSKSLLHIAKIIEETRSLYKYGIFLNELEFDISKIRSWKENIVNKLSNGLNIMSKLRKITVIHGCGYFINKNQIKVKTIDNDTLINFNYAIIAAGSSSIKSPIASNNDSRIWYSTEALSLPNIPKNLLVIGGGIIGLEMATIYNALGSNIDIVEINNQIIIEADKDIVSVFIDQVSNYFNLKLETKVKSIKSETKGIYVSIENKNGIIESKYYDNILLSIGRKPNSDLLKLDQIGIEIDNQGFIKVNQQMCTNVPNIYAIGDIIGKPMLAHKSIYEGRLVAEIISGKKYYFNSNIIPSIAYTDPEIAWVGITEKEAQKKGINYATASFPWKLLGRALASNIKNGLTKLIFNKNSNQIIGGAIVGNNGGELLSEIGLAIEMGCDAQDIALTIHAHPTLYESIGLTAEIYEGTITDIINPNIKK